MSFHYKYIDRLKGFAILTVVMGHFVQWGLYIKNDIIVSLISSFHMPLFMFLSGLVISAPPSFKKCITKLFRFYMPFLIVGSVYTIFSQHQSLYNFAFHQMKLGYWYLWTLGIFYICLVCFNLRIPKIKEWMKDLLLFILFFIVFGILNKLLPEPINNLLSIKQCYGFWSWFGFGYFMNKYHGIAFLLNHNWVYTICIISFIPFYWMVHYGGLHFYKPMNLCAIVSILYLFRLREEMSSVFEQKLEFIGKKSLDVYIYHYFFIWLFALNSVGDWFSLTKNLFIEFIFLLIVSTILAFTSIFIGYVIKKSTFLNQLIYGEFIFKLIPNTRTNN